MLSLQKGSRGSSAVEYAMVFPLIILIVSGIIFTGLKMYAHVKEDAEGHSGSSQLSSAISTETVLRGKWTLLHGDSDEKEDEDREN